jgi:hypothetical protein
MAIKLEAATWGDNTPEQEEKILKIVNKYFDADLTSKYFDAENGDINNYLFTDEYVVLMEDEEKGWEEVEKLNLTMEEIKYLKSIDFEEINFKINGVK